MANNYVRKNLKQKRLNEISDFVVESGTIPSYNTISKRFGISVSTVYALMRELMVTDRLRIIKGERSCENNHLPLRTVSMGKEAHAQKKAHPNVSGTSNEIEGAPNDQRRPF